MTTMVTETIQGNPVFLAGLWFFGLVFASFGVVGLASPIREFWPIARRGRFEPVRAQVLGAHLDVNRSSDSKTYTPAIEYEYTVGGETYATDSVYPEADLGGPNKSAFQEVVDRYSEGDVVGAYDDPDDPSVAFLEDEPQLGGPC